MRWSMDGGGGGAPTRWVWKSPFKVIGIGSGAAAMDVTTKLPVAPLGPLSRNPYTEIVLFTGWAPEKVSFVRSANLLFLVSSSACSSPVKASAP